MKRVLALILACMLCLTATAEVLDYDGTAPLFDEPVTISILTKTNTNLNWQEMPWFSGLFEMANVNPEIEMFDSTSYRDVAKARLAAGVNLPDLVKLPNADQDMTYINSGLFIELTDLIEKYGYNIKRVLGEGVYENVMKQMMTPDGEIYYIPALNPSNSIRTPMINAAWLEKLNMDAPKNMDEFYEMLVAFKNNDVNGNGDVSDEVPLFTRPDRVALWGIYWGLDLSVGWKADDDGVVSCSYATDAYYEFLKYFNKLYAEGLLYNEFAVATSDTQAALFANDQIGVNIDYISNMTGYSTSINPEWDSSKDALIMQAFEPLTGPYGDKVVYGNMLFDGSGCMGITVECENPEEVFCFLDWVWSDEALTLMWYGQEGVDYTMDENGNMVLSEQYLVNKDNYKVNNGYNIRCLNDIKIDSLAIMVEPTQTQEIYDMLMPYLEMPTVQYCYSLSDEVDVLSMYKADIKTYFSEMLISFITGATPLTEESFADYRKKLDALHVEDLTAVYQAQYDRMQG